MDNVEKADSIVRKLAATRKDLLAKAEELGAERQALAFDAATGNKQAKARLAEATQAQASNHLEIENISNAYQVACERLQIAQAEATQAVERDNAKRRLLLASELRALGRKLDSNFSGELCKRLEKLGAEINQAGSVTPSAHQVRVFGLNAILTMLANTQWAREFEAIAPGQRTTFSKICDGWATTVENAARVVAGEKEEAA